MSFYSEIYDNAVDLAESNGELDTAEHAVAYLDSMTAAAGCIYRLGYHVVRRFDRAMLESICRLLDLQFSIDCSQLCVSTLRRDIVHHFFDIQRGA